MTISIKLILFVTSWLAIVFAALIATSKMGPADNVSIPAEVIVHLFYIVVVFGFLCAAFGNPNSQPYWIGFSIVSGFLIFAGIMPKIPVTPEPLPLQHSLINWLSTFWCDPKEIPQFHLLQQFVASLVLAYGFGPLMCVVGGLVSANLRRRRRLARD